MLSAGTAKADTPSGQLLPSGEPLVWMDNCPFDARRPHQMRCLSKRLVPKSYADARAIGPFTPPPDAGFGVDASAAISPPCDGNTGGGGGGGTASGLGPPDYIKAYNIPTSPTGAGKVVAIVDACAESTVVADLAAYRSQYGLPALPECGGADGHAPMPGASTPCIGVVSQRGGADLPPPDDGWAGEIALDVEMVSAACPECNILLVEADSPNSWDLGPAESEAVTLGASAISNSYGANEDPTDPFGTAYSDGPYASYFEHDGVLITVASGDWNYDGENPNPLPTPPEVANLAPSFPSSVPNVLSVGGTSLTPDTGVTRGYDEVVWSGKHGGTGSGCSLEFPKPAFQSAIDMGTCTMRADVDVAAPASGVATYQGGWGEVGGTSCASPFVAALLTRLGLASQPNAFFYANGSAFFDITSGNNDPSHKCTNTVMCNAGVGWDGPTGWGSPNAAALLAVAPAGVDAGITDSGSDATLGNDAATADDASGGGSGSSSGGGSGSSSGGGSGSSSGGVIEPDDSGTGNGASGNSNGCNCTTVGGSPAQGTPAGLALVALGSLVAVTRRRRR
jgi:MYXO-CTERM domain-containing protein